jgi:site-specific DNA-methyltransferase (adenine-specific)
MEYMATLKDKAFDLAIVDPPYGIGADKKNSGLELKSRKSASLSKDYGKQRWDNDIPTDKYFIELKRVSVNQIVWGNNFFGLRGGAIYWHKEVTMPTYSDGEIAYCSLINSVRFFRYAWHGMIQENMKNKEFRIHPTQKPVALYQWLLKNYAKQGDKILDTHLGSGSSAIACDIMGFDFVGIEIDADYYKAALDRFNRHKQQLTLEL